MKFGINSLLFTDSFIERDLELFDRAHEMGFEILEIAPVNLDTFPLRKVKQAAKDTGMEVNINFALPDDANPISPEPGVRRKSIELSKRVLDVCAELDADVYCGANYCAWTYLTGKPRSEDEWFWGIECYREICEYAADVAPDLILGAETLNRFESHFLNTAADALRFVKNVGMDNATVHLDTFHMIREEDDMAAAVRACGDRLGYFHACGSQRGIPGKDMTPWVDVLTAVKDTGYDRGIVIESFHPDLSLARLVAVWRHFADTPDRLAEEGLAFLRETVGKVWSDA